jgi:UDP-glucuronate 4-epimerase
LQQCRGQECVLLTGGAGFIGFHTALALAGRGTPVVIIDSLSSYYDVELKVDRLACLGIHCDHGLLSSSALDVSSSSTYPICFIHADLRDPELVSAAFSVFNISSVLHLAAQAGVRYSLTAPESYLSSNIDMTFHLLQAAARAKIRHFVFASSSSVYGVSSTPPFRESEPANEPVSLYAASKKAGEELAYSSSSVSALPTSVLRFFTVYGPWSRPDMALYSFGAAMLKGDPIVIYNAAFSRDFTFVGDVVEALLCVLERPPQSSLLKDAEVGGRQPPPFRVLNVASGHPYSVAELVEELERALHLNATRSFEPALSVDVPRTWAATDKLHKLCGVRRVTALSDGVDAFAGWLGSYSAWRQGGRVDGGAAADLCAPSFHTTRVTRAAPADKGGSGVA